ncbi:MAG TPA: UDP-N-acetylmuramoyl-tripeptide--D-alanyl-D-alanine ligase [Thermoanaerobaculia bacterium]|nr:UDP-N-acetylmuramoyl-tripeptide--D-alanyl-D-alanine ligase [Thermoanaerobaculia bacterium]
MPTLTFAEIAAMTGGQVIEGGEVVTSSVVIDSREVKPDSVFFAIQGERLDGHQFLPQALATARGAVVSTVPDQRPEGKGIVRVGDTTAALQMLARAIRRRMDFTLIGVTGSAGKTTTKEMIAALLATERRTFKSWGNFNNLIGCPLCIDNTPDDAEVVVSEMGMNKRGEIAELAGLTRPDVGVYTNIAPVHIEFFGTVEKIAEAKRELLENLREGGTVIVNADNEHVVNISRDYRGPKKTYAVDSAAEYRAVKIRERGLLGTRFTLQAEGEEREMELVLPGRHNLENLLAAIATARAVGISWQGIERGVHEVRPADHRGVIVPWRGATIYDDTYNSNPYALARTLELMSQAAVKGRRIAVIGDMLELGEKEELEYHRQAGRGIPKDIDVVIGVGRRSQALLDGAREAGHSRLRHFDDAASAGELLLQTVGEGDLVLIKASRGIGLDRIVTMLEQAGSRPTAVNEGGH